MSGSIMDVFHSDPFSFRALTAAMEKVPFKPSLLTTMGIFDQLPPLYTRDLMVESREGQLMIIPTSELAAPPTERRTEQRFAIPFRVPRLAHGDTINSYEIQFIRDFGEMGEMMLAGEVNRRMEGPTGIRANLETTWERHKLSAIQGKLIDADNSVIFNYYTAFGVSEPGFVNFDLTRNTGPGQVPGYLRRTIGTLAQAMLRAAKMPQGLGRVAALCGDAFFQYLVTHPDVEKTYANQQEAGELRNSVVFERLEFGGVTWINYRGTDDNSTIAIGTLEARFFPVDAPGVFGVGWGPDEFFDNMGQPGRPITMRTMEDPATPKAWWRQEAYSYPIHICLRPEALAKGTVFPVP